MGLARAIGACRRSHHIRKGHCSGLLKRVPAVSRRSHLPGRVYQNMEPNMSFAGPDFAALDCLNNEETTVADVVAFYTDIINQLVQNDRAIMSMLLNCEQLPPQIRASLNRWGGTVEAIVETAIARHFASPGTKPQ